MEEIKTDMQYTDHVKFQEKGTMIKRVIAVVLLFVVIAALFGAFGFGGWTKKSKGNGTTLEVKYESMLRANKGTVMEVYVTNPDSADITLKFSSNYFDKINFEKVIPHYVINEFDKGSVVYKFRQMGKGTHKIIFSTMPKEAGNLVFTLGDGTNNYTINQLIYP